MWKRNGNKRNHQDSAASDTLSTPGQDDSKDVSDDSVLKASTREIMDFLGFRNADAVDKLARRAVTLVLSSKKALDFKPESLDRHAANIFASAALQVISDGIKHYPFVVPGSAVDEPGDAESIMTAARELIAAAERLLPPFFCLPHPMDASDIPDPMEC